MHHTKHQKRLGSLKTFIRSFMLLTFLFIISITSVAKESLVDDCEHGGFINKFSCPWFVMDDNATHPYFKGKYDESSDTFLDSLKGGNSKITNAEKNNGQYGKFHMTYGEGNPNGTKGYAAKIEFAMGDTMPYSTPYNKYGCWVGIATHIVSPKKGILDLTGATKISYWAKSSSVNHPVNVSFIVLTDQGRFKLFSTYYQRVHEVTHEWEQFSITLDTNEATGLSLPEWVKKWPPIHPADNGKILTQLPLDISKSFSLQWLITVDANQILKNETGALWIDDIQIHNYTYEREDLCKDCQENNNSVSGTSEYLLSDGSATNALGESWEVFNDVEDRKVTKPFFEYSYIDKIYADSGKSPGDLSLKLTQSGSGSTGDLAAKIDFTFGPMFKKEYILNNTIDTTNIKPYVGLRLNLSNSNKPELYFNTDSANFGGIYFKYKTVQPTSNYVFVEFGTTQKKDFLIKNTNFYLTIPGTNNEWKYAKIPFSKLKISPWNLLDDSKKFRSSQLQQITWRVEGDSSNYGSMIIDSVYFIKKTVSSINTNKYLKSNDNILINQVNNNIVFSLPAYIKNVRVELLSLQGREICSFQVSNTKNKHCFPEHLNTFPNGLLLVKITDLINNQLLSIKQLIYLKQ